MIITINFRIHNNYITYFIVNIKQYLKYVKRLYKLCDVLKTDSRQINKKKTHSFDIPLHCR